MNAVDHFSIQPAIDLYSTEWISSGQVQHAGLAFIWKPNPIQSTRTVRCNPFFYCGDDAACRVGCCCRVIVRVVACDLSHSIWPDLTRHTSICDVLYSSFPISHHSVSESSGYAPTIVQPSLIVVLSCRNESVWYSEEYFWSPSACRLWPLLPELFI